MHHKEAMRRHKAAIHHGKAHTRRAATYRYATWPVIGRPATLHRHGATLTAAQIARLPIEARLSLARAGIQAVRVWTSPAVLLKGVEARDRLVPSYGVTHIATSALFGHPGLSLIAGEDDVYGRVFRGLGKTRVGDTIVIAQRRHSYRYIVILVRTVAPNDVRLLNARYTRPTLALVTSAPYGKDTQRVVVLAALR